MARTPLLIGLIWIMIFGAGDFAWAALTIDAQTTAEIELNGYNGLSEILLFKGRISSGIQQKIDTWYRGLALLHYSTGQVYPLIVGDEDFGLIITRPGERPSFTSSDNNEIFYRWLSTGDAVNNADSRHDFARLMIEANDLLDSSHSIRSLSELSAKKIEFQDFVRNHYQRLKRSDMVRRLIAQYFMMHEYADYSNGTTPATSIKMRYQQEVLDGVGNWLEILKTHIPEHEIVNYCISLYYQRSMATLAALIVEKYRNIAFCPGVEKETWRFPKDLLISWSNGMTARQLHSISGDKIIVFISENCPVSMVEAVMKVRHAAHRKETIVILPLEQLNDAHLSLCRMVRGGKMLFVDDD